MNKIEIRLPTKSNPNVRRVLDKAGFHIGDIVTHHNGKIGFSTIIPVTTDQLTQIAPVIRNLERQGLRPHSPTLK